MVVSDISKSLQDLKDCINSYTELPTGVVCRIGDTPGRTKGIGIKIKTISSESNICGSENSTLIVDINYQEPAQTDNDKLGVIDMMSDLMDWVIKSLNNVLISRMPMMSDRSQSGIDLYNMQIRMFC